MDREEIARELQDKYENKNYYRMADPKTPILINKYEKIADWHIAELEKAKRSARAEVAREIYSKLYEDLVLEGQENVVSQIDIDNICSQYLKEQESA